MNIKAIFTPLFLLLIGSVTAFAQATIQRGIQITKESDLVSGKPYILYYVGNKEGAYVKANSSITYFSVSPNDVNLNDEAVFILTKEGTTWKIQSQKTGLYFPIPSGTADDKSYQANNFKPAASGDAGSWKLNFLANGALAPYYGDQAYSLNRSDGKLHAFSYGEADVNQLKIYELGFIADATKVYTVKDNQGNGVANISNSWAFVSTGFGNYYYLYNTVAKQFAYPIANGEWTLSESAVPVSVNYHGIVTKDGVAFKIGNETNLKIEKTDVAVDETELNAAMAKLMDGQTAITDASQITDGWYALRIIEDGEHPEYEGNFLYTLDTPYNNGGTLYYPYPVSHGGTYRPHPTNDDATYYFRLWYVGIGDDGIKYYHWQLPNGIYIVNYSNNFPIRYHKDLSDFIIGKNSDGSFYIQSSGFRTKAFDEYIGKTAHKYIESSTKLEIREIDLSSTGANITPWRVVFNEGADNIPLTCSRTDLKGLKTVYNNGYFFLPSDVTPSSSDFATSVSGFAGSAEVNVSDHTIHVTYAPDICFTADNVSVAQGSRTTGIGNTKQVLLRVKVEPQAPCKLSSLEVTLAGAEQFDRVETYLTTADQLHADGVSSTLLGSKNSGLTGNSDEPLGNINISLSGSPVLRMGETYYVWLTADIKSGAQESEIVDAAIVGITYTNAKDNDQPVDLTSKGDPEGNMRIFKAQSFVKVSAENNGTEAQYYRNPAILNIGANTVLAFCDYRYDNVNGLGKDYDGSNYGHRMDVIVRKSTDNGKTWGNAVAIAAGTEGTTPSGYAGPAVVKSGDRIICLMASGSTAYDSSEGLRHVAISTSEDGSTWTTPSEVSIDWGTLSPTSFYVTPGKGVEYTDGHVAFVINAKVDGRLQEYLLYSDAAITTWTVDPTPLSGKGKESKLQLKNDGSLLVMGKTPVSKECNNDLLSFKRSGDGNTSYDAVLQTVIWKNEGSRLKDMRLYASFDQATTWKELFYIQPGNAATSSIQKLSDGDLAICFEDGSIGNDEKDGCYALTYVVIGEAMIGEQSAETNTATIIATGVTARTAPNVNGSGWTKSVVTNKASGFPDITISANHAAFNREGTSQRYFIIKPSAAGATDEITITAPPGYVIKSYSITGDKKNASENYTLTSGNQTATFNGGEARTLAVDDIFSPTATFTFKSNSATNSSYSLISDFTIILAREEYGVKLNRVNDNGTGKSYATLYTAYDLRQTDETTKAYYITEVTDDGKAVLTLTGNDGRDIPKNTAVVLINSEGNTYTEFTLVSNMAQVVPENENMLKGTLVSMSLDMASNTNYYSFGRRRVKADGNSDWGNYVAGFYNTGKTITLGANRAYLDASAQALSRGFDLPWGGDDVTTSMADEMRLSPEEQNVETPYYTLDGRQINGKPTIRGIYIKDRKKVLVK